jgi:photosystem II stability/assembly factor-like uncharacterized protein
LYFTDDGGKSWTAVKPEKSLETFLTHGENITQLNFVDGNCGWALAENNHGWTRLLQTSDGGKTWNAIDLNH